MVIDKYVIVKGYGKNMKYYASLGYDLKFKEEIEIPIKDLNKSSNIKVDIKYDSSERIYKYDILRLEELSRFL